jgi:hypothetical protein
VWDDLGGYLTLLGMENGDNQAVYLTYNYYGVRYNTYGQVAIVGLKLGYSSLTFY